MKAFFLSRNLREKLLLLVFGLIVVSFAISLTSKHVKAFNAQWRATSATLGVQKQWLENRAAVEKAAAKAVENLDPSKTFSTGKLVGEVTTIAEKAGLINKFVSDIVSSGEKTSQFAVNTVRLKVTNASMAEVLSFYDELGKRFPYIGIEQFTLTVNKANTQQVSFSMRVSSVEVIR